MSRLRVGELKEIWRLRREAKDVGYEHIAPYLKFMRDAAYLKFAETPKKRKNRGN